jgi:uncharacterized protein YegL
MSEQIPFGAIEFAANPEPRCPCVLALDTSSSMVGARLDELQRGIAQFKNELMGDPLARKRVEIAVLTFGGGVRLASDFATVDAFDPPALHADGLTPLGAAVLGALDLVKNRKNIYRSNGIAYYRPWVFLLTDGEPSDPWQAAARAVREAEAQRALAFFAVGVGEANMDVLGEVSVRAPLKLKGMMFSEMFQWLSTSLKSVSHSGLTDELPLSNPAVPEGWAKL